MQQSITFEDNRPVIEILAEHGYTVGDRKNALRRRNIIDKHGNDLGFHSPLEALEKFTKK